MAQIHPQDIHGDEAVFCPTEDRPVFQKTKVLLPGIHSWMEEPHILTRARHQPARITALVPVAAHAGESQIEMRGFSMVLPCDDMLDLEGFVCGMFRQAAVFAPASGTLSGRDGERGPCLLTRLF